MDGKESVGNSGRAPLERSDTRKGREGEREGNRGKWGELCWEGAIYGSGDKVDGRETHGESSIGKERYGSDERVDGKGNRGK